MCTLCALCPMWFPTMLVCSSLKEVPHKRLHRLILRQAQLIVRLCSCAVAVFSAYPELAFVISREHGAIFLRLVLKYRAALAHEFVRTERNGHFDLVDIPLDRKSTRLNSSHVKISY